MTFEFYGIARYERFAWSKNIIIIIYWRETCRNIKKFNTYTKMCAHTPTQSYIIHIGQIEEKNQNISISIEMKRNANQPNRRQPNNTYIYLSRLHCIFVDCLSTVPCSITHNTHSAQL